MERRRDRWWHDADRRPADRVRARADERRGSALHPLHVGLDRQAERRAAHDRRLSRLRELSRTNACSICATDDIYWCTADVGWVTGHSYIVYGPLANGATTLMFEGVPNYPDCVALLAGRRQAQGHHLLHRADRDPRADARRRSAGEEDARAHRCACSARVGEPINPEAWEWYHRVVGDGRCPIVDTWWQTETGGILITPLPGAIDARSPARRRCRSSASKPAIVDANGNVLEGAAEGNLVLHRLLARPDAHGLRRSPALHRHVFQDVSRQVLHRRRRAPRRRTATTGSPAASTT